MVAIRGTFRPYLVQYTQNISVVDIRGITWSRARVRLLRPICYSNFNQFFLLQYPISGSNWETKIFMGRGKNWWERRSPIMEKPECRGSLATIPRPNPSDLQLQLELLSSLQNLIIYHKMDIIKSAWINPWYCIPIRIKWICKMF